MLSDCVIACMHMPQSRNILFVVGFFSTDIFVDTESLASPMAGKQVVLSHRILDELDVSVYKNQLKFFIKSNLINEI